MRKPPVYVTRSWMLFLLAWLVAAATHYHLSGAVQLARSFGNALFIWLVPLVLVAVARLCRGLRSDRASLTAFWIIGLILLALNLVGELDRR
jgi:hypothetical protein